MRTAPALMLPSLVPRGNTQGSWQCLLGGGGLPEGLSALCAGNYRYFWGNGLDGLVIWWLGLALHPPPPFMIKLPHPARNIIKTPAYTRAQMLPQATCRRCLPEMPAWDC